MQNHLEPVPANEIRLTGGATMRKVYKYGMRLRGFAPGAQPMLGFLRREDDPLGDYWDILVYDRMQTVEDERHYSLDYLGAWQEEDE